MKCIVCGAEIDSIEENKVLCRHCEKMGYLDDAPEECQKKCQNVWSFPDCLWECATIPDDDKYAILARMW